MNEAALNATRRKAQATMELQDFTAAIERIVAGLERKNRAQSGREGKWPITPDGVHALVAMALPGNRSGTLRFHRSAWHRCTLATPCSGPSKTDF